MTRWIRGLGALALGLLAAPLAAKPIAYARGTTLMAEYGAGTMNEVQAFYAPRYWWSAGAGWLALDSEDGTLERDIVYVRANLLGKRWNLPGAQANVFVWGGLGRARGSDFGSVGTRNVGAQVDYETRRVYASLRSDLHYSRRFSHRIDTVQLGWAPYAHDYESLATWLVVQARHYTSGLYDGIEPALVLRLFKGPVWVELGSTSKGELQAMLMINY